MPTQASSSNAYTHSSAPQALKPGHKQKYREDEEIAPLSLMSDPRVVRGSTQGLVRKIVTQNKNKKSTNNQRMMSQSGSGLPTGPAPSLRPTYTFDVPGFSSDINLDEYLTDGINPDDKYKNLMIKMSQTDEFKDKPPSPPYVPRKTGVDNTTQVEDVTELFNFDLEVAPMLDVIVAKTLEQALFEIDAEEELKRLELEIGRFGELKQNENAEILALENATRQSFIERERLLKEQEECKKMEISVRTRAAGAEMVRQLLPAIQSEITQELLNSGEWIDPTMEAIKNELADSINTSVKRVELQYAATEILDEILLQAQTNYQDLIPEYITPTTNTITIKMIVEKEKLGEEATENIELDIELELNDTIIDLERKTRDVLVEKAVPPGIVKVALSSFINAACGRNVARDAKLMNFSTLLPTNLNIVLESP